MKNLAHLRRVHDVSTNHSSSEVASDEARKLPLPGQAIDVRVKDIVLGRLTRPVSDSKVSQFAASIRDQGLHQPIHVYELNDTQRGKFGLAAGRHRLQALISLGYATVPAVVITRRKAKAWRYSENLHRSGLGALEMSEAIMGYAFERENLPDVKEVLPRGGQQPNDKGYSKLAKALGFDRKRIAEAFQHNALPESVKGRVRKHIKLNKRRTLNALIALDSEKSQLILLKRELCSDEAPNAKAKPHRRNDWVGETSQEKNSAEGSSSKPSPMKQLRRAWKRSEFRKLYLQQKTSVRKRFVEKYM
jgi:ParB-like chromosome segregation protein Spo0J